MMTPNVLRDNFYEELLSAQLYAKLLARRISVYDADIRTVGRYLVKIGILDTDISLPTDSSEIFVPQSSLVTISHMLTSIREQVEDLHYAKQLEFDVFDNSDVLRRSDFLSFEDDIAKFFLDALSDEEPSEQEKRSLFSQIRSHIQQNIDEDGKEENGVGRDIDASISKAYQYARAVKVMGEIQRLQFVLRTIDELSVISQITQPGNILNTYRQAFIVLMTAFDATVFDLMRLALQNNFFQLIGSFGKKETFPLRDLPNFSSFEQLRDSIIEDALKVRYLKDLLIILRSLGVMCVDPSSNYSFGYLIELVLRRNLHMHNRGIVDSRYGEPNETGGVSYNVYSLSVGDTAIIDEEYWERATFLCLHCVKAIAEWIEDISQSKPKVQ